MSYRGMSTKVEIQGEYPDYGELIGTGGLVYKGVDGRYYTGTPRAQGPYRFLDLTEISAGQYDILAKYGIIKKLRYDAFCDLVQNGESRHGKQGVSYVLITEDGEENFYAEWNLDGVETDEDGEVTPAGWAEVERIDAEQLPKAYAAYVAGEKTYQG